jgi:hypothetical protein
MLVLNPANPLGVRLERVPTWSGPGPWRTDDRPARARARPRRFHVIDYANYALEAMQDLVTR